MTPDFELNKLFILFLGYLLGFRLVVTCYTGYVAYYNNNKYNLLKFGVFLSLYLCGLYSTCLNALVIVAYEMVNNPNILNKVVDGYKMLNNLETNNSRTTLYSMINKYSMINTIDTIYNNYRSSIGNNVLFISTRDNFYKLNSYLNSYNELFYNTLYNVPYVGNYYKKFRDLIAIKDKVNNKLDSGYSGDSGDSADKQDKMTKVANMFSMLNNMMVELNKEKEKMDRERIDIVNKINNMSKKQD